ncbi:LysE family translocator [Cupriavidus taiwanensis]|nr:LysE family translocator [Cupriavidus taiwanensis]
MVAGAHALALLSPGPDFFLVVRSALLHGPRRAGAVCLGIALGNGVFIGLALAGVAAMRDSPQWFAALQWAGCAYLAWLGWRLLRASGELSIPAADAAARPAAADWPAQLASGFLSAVLNPKNGLFYASLFSAGRQSHAAGGANRLWRLDVCRRARLGPAGGPRHRASGGGGALRALGAVGRTPDRGRAVAAGVGRCLACAALSRALPTGRPVSAHFLESVPVLYR